MGLFKSIAKAAGGFFKSVANSTVGKTVLGVAATAVGGPVAGALVTKATSLLGDSNLASMASKVIETGIVKTDKVASTLTSNGVAATSDNVSTVANALKSAASGISGKSYPISSGYVAATPIDSGTGTSFIDKVKIAFFNVKNWIVANWKKILLFGVLPLVVIWVLWTTFGKRKKWRV